MNRRLHTERWDIDRARPLEQELLAKGDMLATKLRKELRAREFTVELEAGGFYVVSWAASDG